jgi:hypothetical protein
MMMVSPAPALKPTKIVVADQADQHAQSEQTYDQAKQRDRKGSKAGNLRIADRIAGGGGPTAAAIINEIAEVEPTASCRDEPSSIRRATGRVETVRAGSMSRPAPDQRCATLVERHLAQRDRTRRNAIETTSVGVGTRSARNAPAVAPVPNMTKTPR